MSDSPPYRRIIVWFRRALRTDDNVALWQAVQDAGSVVPLLCLSADPSYDVPTHRREFIRSAITGLDSSLREAGTSLHIRTGAPESAIPAAAVAYGADAVYAVTLTDPAGLERDARIERALKELRIPFVRFPDRVLRGAHEVLTGTRTPFRVFTPYKRVWLAGAEDCARPVPGPRHLPAVEPAPGTRSLDAFRWTVQRGGGSGAALARLKIFLVKNAGRYAEQRDFPGIDGTSKLSPFLSVGAISIRRLYREVCDAREHATASALKGIETFISELIWREFYSQVLVHFPHAMTGSFRPEFATLAWGTSTKNLKRWQEGTTGYPIVDAAMRQLRDEGWMHNRARMIVASFLTKDLHLNWQWGERFFFSQLIDADLAANNGGWQWTAGTGTDASPWFRIFNPVLQGKKFDPDGAYIRSYVPELAGMPAAGIHEPWLVNRQEQTAAGCVIGRDYPAPMVDHAEARKKTMALYRVSDKTGIPAPVG
jgi:deoxyribodipyrimidine photo-lyase